MVLISVFAGACSQCLTTAFFLRELQYWTRHSVISGSRRAKLTTESTLGILTCIPPLARAPALNRLLCSGEQVISGLGRTKLTAESTLGISTCIPLAKATAPNRPPRSGEQVISGSGRAKLTAESTLLVSVYILLGSD